MLFGRDVCDARSPRYDEYLLVDICPSRQKNVCIIEKILAEVRLKTTTGGIMSKSCVKMESLVKGVFLQKVAEETNQEIGAHFGLSKEQIEGLVNQQNRKQRLVENEYAPQLKGHPRKTRLRKTCGNTTRLYNCVFQHLTEWYICVQWSICVTRGCCSIVSAMTTALVTDTIRDTRQKEMATDGPVLHSDQGSKYTSKTYLTYHKNTTFNRPCLVPVVHTTMRRWKFSSVR